MTVGTRLPLAGGVAVLLASIALEPVFVNLRWFGPVVLVLSVVVAISVLARRFSATAPWAPLLELAGALLALTALYVPGNALLGVLPTPASLGEMRTLLEAAGYAVRTQVSPAQSLDELIFLAAIGVAVVAVTVDILAVSMRRPAVAGLALLVLYSIPTAALVQGIPWWPFVGGTAGFLLLLFVDSREHLLRWGRRPDDEDQAPTFGLVAAQRIGLLAVVCGIALPLLVPALPPGLIRPAGGGAGAGPGTSLSPLAQLVGELRLPESLDLLRVQTNVDDPYYLRVTSLEVYTDQGWALASLDDTFDAGAGDLPGAPGSSRTRTVDAQIEVLDHDDRFLPTYYATRQVDGGGDWRFDEISGTVWSEDDRTGGRTYRVLADEPVPTVGGLRAADDLDSEDQVQRRFTALPLVVRPEVSQLVTSLTEGADGPYERTRAIMDFFTDPENGFFYSLSTEPGTSGDELVDFLVSRRGYCEQYAAAMAVMLRFADVPSRVALGYTPGQQNAGEWTVTTDDAHAWVEAYFEGIGWVPFDPTPLGGGRGVQRDYAPRLDAANPTATASRSGPSASNTAAAPTAQLEEDLLGTPGDPTGGDSAGLLDPVTLLLSVGVVLVVVALLSPATLRMAARRRRVRAARGGRREGALAAWDELLATAADFRSTAKQADTPRVTARRLAREHGFEPDTRESIRLLAVAEERARYAPAEQAEVEGDLAGSLRTVSRALRAQATPRARVLAVLFPASTMVDLRAALQGVRTRARGRWLSMRRPAPVS